MAGNNRKFHPLTVLILAENTSEEGKVFHVLIYDEINWPLY